MMTANDNIHPGIRIGVDCIRFLMGERKITQEQEEEFRQHGKPEIDALIINLMDAKR